MVRRERSRGRVRARVRSVASPIVPWGAGESRLHRQPYGAPADRGRRGATVWGRSAFSEFSLPNIDSRSQKIMVSLWFFWQQAEQESSSKKEPYNQELSPKSPKRTRNLPAQEQQLLAHVKRNRWRWVIEFGIKEIVLEIIETYVVISCVLNSRTSEV